MGALQPTEGNRACQTPASSHREPNAPSVTTECRYIPINLMHKEREMSRNEDANQLAAAIAPIVRREVRAAIEQLKEELASPPADRAELTREKFLTIKDLVVEEKRAPSTIWKNIADGTFPRPIKLGGSSRWLQSEVDDYYAKLAALRNGDDS